MPFSFSPTTSSLSCRRGPRLGRLAALGAARRRLRRDGLGGRRRVGCGRRLGRRRGGFRRRFHRDRLGRRRLGGLGRRRLDGGGCCFHSRGRFGLRLVGLVFVHGG
ncbi:MAG: hypothetical protein U0470_02105 [Anaerolineae bacterium]